ncbi:cytochrome c nitrite reductase small subunit [candidate division KSB1 bacterium]|nr:cytochrome c nitrite reductase small subunit [candidate division KSB1 bacterium]
MIPFKKYQKWLILLSVMICGVLLGLGGFTFFYAQGASYLVDDPEACMNCHVMRDQYDGWNRSSHHEVATCNSCHTPHDLFGKYATKALNGWNHSAAFTTGNYDETINIHNFNAKIAHDNCLRCHRDVVSRMKTYAYPEKVDCMHCHGNVGHSNRF